MRRALLMITAIRQVPVETRLVMDFGTPLGPTPAPANDAAAEPVASAKRPRASAA